MALTAGTLFSVQASATTGNTGGAGFNPTNVNFPIDLAATVANTSAPVVTSATYTFVDPGDVGNWVYVQSGTHWQTGWYQIASVAGGAATLTAGIGTVVTAIGTTGVVTLNTTAGCTSDNTATLSGGVFGVDYSQQDTANSSISNAVSVGSSTTLTSASNPWTPVSVGNLFHLTTTGTGGFGVVGWYEIVTYVSAGQVTTDRTTNSGTALAAGTGQTGGAGRLNGLEDTFQAMLPAGGLVWIKNGSYTFSGAVSTANSNGTLASPIFWRGFNTIRGDTCNGSNRPIWELGANAVTLGTRQYIYNLIINTTASAGITLGTSGRAVNCKIFNSSSTASRSAITIGNLSYILNCELISQNGNGARSSAGAFVFVGNYVHDSNVGLTNVGANSSNTIASNIFEGMTTTGISIPTGYTVNNIINNTIYGREAKMGVGLDLTKANSDGNQLVNNIFYGLTTGVQVATGASGSNISINNDFYNNTSDVSNWTKGTTDIAINPSFTGATQITGATATTSSSTLTQSGGDFSTVTNNVDFLHVTSGTGVTTGCYLITSHTGTTLTVNNALGTSSGGDVNYWISTGHNFQVGTSLAGVGFPTFSNSGGETTSYPEVGAVTRDSNTVTAVTTSHTYVG